MVKNVKHKVNPYDVIKQLADATHLEVQYFLPYLPAWLANPEDDLLVDMNSISLALLMYAVDGQLFVPGGKKYTH